MGFQLFTVLKMAPFAFCHAPEDAGNDAFYWCGHLHPGIRLRGKGKQSITLPCFFLSQHMGILPAFGSFTGLALQKPKAGERVFALADGEVFECQGRS